MRRMQRWRGSLPTGALVALITLVGCGSTEPSVVQAPRSPHSDATAEQAGEQAATTAADAGAPKGVRSRSRAADVQPSAQPEPGGEKAKPAGDTGETAAENPGAQASPAKNGFPAPPVGKPAGRPPAKAFEEQPRAHDTDTSARLIGVVVEERDGWEELTFTFDSAEVPTYAVSYVDAVRPHEEADPVPLEGGAFLQVEFSATDPSTDGQMTVPSDLRPEQAQLKEILLVQNLGGELRFGVALAARVGFHVQELESPTRLVVQVPSS